MANMNFKAAAAVAALSALFLAGCSDGAKTEPSTAAAHLQPLRRRRNLQQHHLRLRILPLPHSPAAAACR